MIKYAPSVPNKLGQAGLEKYLELQAPVGLESRCGYELVRHNRTL